MGKSNQKGITIIALVITIIILLILAAVTIYAVINGGLFKTTGESTDKYKRTEEKELIRLAYANTEVEYQAFGTSITAESFGEQLKGFNSNTETVEMEEGASTEGYEIVVDRTDETGYAHVTFTETQHEYLVALKDEDKYKIKYEVTYNANGGQGGPTKQLKVEGKPLKITTDKPQRAGYNFLGWGTSAISEEPAYYPGGTYEQDTVITLYAVWSEIPYTITYNLNGGTQGVGGTNPTEYNAGTPTFTLKNPTKTDYAFTGWTGTDLVAATRNVIIFQGSSGNREYTANWELPNYIVDETEYAITLQQAIELAEATGSTIRVMRNTADNEQATVDKQITLELNGHTITTNTSITIAAEGDLTIQDTGNAGELTGKIQNTTGTVVTNNGTLQLGNNEGTITLSPTIEGTTNAITTTGTFRFYDGRVIGETAIIGEDVETPSTYHAMAVLDTQTGTETVELQALGSAVARVGYRYYGTVQAAIDSAEGGYYTYEDATLSMIQSMQENGTYYFTYDSESQTLVPNNKGLHSTTANSYIEIDLSRYSTETTHTVVVNASVSSQTNYDYGYATITKTTTAPAYNSTTGRFMNISGTKANTDYTTTLAGGEIYYLHLGYRKNSSNNTGNDTVIINNIILDGEEIITPITLNIPETQTKITLVTNVTVSGESINVPDIKNIKLDLNGYTLSTSGSIYTIKNYGKLEITDTSEGKMGNILNSVKEAIYNDTLQNLILTEMSCTAPSAGTSSSYKYFIYNKKGELNAINFTYNSTYTYTGFLNIVNGIVDTENTTITATSLYFKAINASGAGNVTIQNITINDKMYGIYNEGTGRIEINGGTITTTATSGYYSYGIYNNSTGTIEINGGTIIATATTYSYGVYNNSTGTIEINGGRISATTTSYYSYGIYNKSIGTIKITGGNILSTKIAVYGSSSTTIVVGTKGGEISIDNPEIQGGTYAIQGNFKFYDGIIKGPIGAIQEIEEDASLIKETVERNRNNNTYKRNKCGTNKRNW